MSTLATVLVLLIAVLHVYIMVMEMFLWTGPRARASFGLTQEFAEQTKSLAANQGLYNGFLAAGLFWGAIADDRAAKFFFLICVAVAGLYGAATASRKILFVQTVPAALALLALALS
ncbi:DUF1304 domain-containing protein [Streptomyces sp. NPDC050738]|uniref:DUF1304 domain-containing protein n=1 Tax=Streptomyces sp. NPDC050738 TaxID=3154744 RepID=UPI00344A1F91